MAAVDDVNRELREFKRYTGDGLPGEPAGAPLPVGDPASGPHSPKKSGLRAMLLAVLQRAQDILDQAAAGIVPDGGVTEPKHATGGVSSRALAALSVITSKLADGAVTLLKIGDDAKADFRMVGDSSRALSVVYHGMTSVRVQGRATHVLNGHFFNGHYSFERGRVVAAPPLTSGAYHVIDIGNGSTTPGTLAYQTSADPDVWYNMFICANAGDAVGVFKTTPALRVGSVAGNVITLNECGENSYALVAKSFNFTTDVMAGSKCLVVTETLTGRENSWSGRVATITANTDTTVTVDVIGGLARGDFIIPLPPYDEYKWLGDFYWEDNFLPTIGEVRNISSDGRDGRSYMINLGDGWPAAAVSVTTGQWVGYAGSVSPLARRLMGQVNITMLASYPAGTAYFEEYSLDTGNHIPARLYIRNPGTTSWPTVLPQIWIEGSYGPFFFFKNGGTPAAIGSHSILVVGWQY